MFAAAAGFWLLPFIYDGPGAPAWAAAGPKQKNGQRTIGLTKLIAIAGVNGVRGPTTA